MRVIRWASIADRCATVLAKQVPSLLFGLAELEEINTALPRSYDHQKPNSMLSQLPNTLAATPITKAVYNGCFVINAEKLV